MQPILLKLLRLSWLTALPLLIVSCSSDEKTNDTPDDDEIIPVVSTPDGYNGLHGYLGYSIESPPPEFNAGAGFYSAVWELTKYSITNFQIGLPGIWLIPDNRDVVSTPLCPIGTVARDNWPERGPTYRDVFQTIEGGTGYWANNQFRYGSPKFSINGTSQCYKDEIATPGWPFFRQSNSLNDDEMGIVQLSNRLLLPPDGITFGGKPNGEFIGYSWMALPFTKAEGGDYPVGENSWTLFLSTQNFKGPVAYYLPETWTKVARNFSYEFAKDKGLDKRMLRPFGGAAMEVNTVPYFSENTDNQSYAKIPPIQYPMNERNRSVLVKDFTYFSKSALFNAVKSWRDGGEEPTGTFAQAGLRARLQSYNSSFAHQGEAIQFIRGNAVETVFGDYSWGLEWNNSSTGEMPEYFRKDSSGWMPIAADQLPNNLTLREKRFPSTDSATTYYSMNSPAWTTPGPTSTVYYANLKDGSTVAYQWYRFVDQPAFQQYQYSEEKKQALQTLIEQIHKNWSIDNNYMPPISSGELVALDDGVMVEPPEGMAFGYVPIVIEQFLAE